MFEIATNYWIISVPIVLLGLSIFVGYFSLGLLFGYGRSLIRLESLEHSLGIGQDSRLEEGQQAPGFDLLDIDGKNVSLSSLVNSKKTVLIVFFESECRHCIDLLPDLANWQEELDNCLNICIINVGGVSEFASIANNSGLSNVLLQGDLQIANDFGIEGTPTAFLIDGDGKLRSKPAKGSTEIRELAIRAGNMCDWTTEN